MACDKTGLRHRANRRFYDGNTILTGLLADNLIFHLTQAPLQRGPEQKGEANAITTDVQSQDVSRQMPVTKKANSL